MLTWSLFLARIFKRNGFPDLGFPLTRLASRLSGSASLSSTPTTFVGSATSRSNTLFGFWDFRRSFSPVFDWQVTSISILDDIAFNCRWSIQCVSAKDMTALEGITTIFSSKQWTYCMDIKYTSGKVLCLEKGLCNIISKCYRIILNILTQHV